MASMLRMSSSKTILQHLDSTVHQFQEVVIFSDGASSQFKKWAYCCLALHSLEEMHDFFATSHCKGPVDAIGGTMKRLVSLSDVR